MIIVDTWISKNIPLYFQDGDALETDIKRLLKGDNSKTFFTKFYDDLWEKAKTKYGLSKKIVSISKNEDDLWRYYMTTLWKEPAKSKEFFKLFDHCFKKVKEDGFEIKHRWSNEFTRIEDI